MLRETGPGRNCNCKAYDLPTPASKLVPFRAVSIERSRDLLGQELAALVGESYERAYQNMVRVQQLTELEETIDYSLAFQLAQGTHQPGAEASRV